MDILKIIPTALLEAYKLSIDFSVLQAAFGKLQDSELSIDTFSFYTSVSAVYSSKIEGENIELDSYVKHKRFGIEFLPDYTRKIDDLYNTYEFAQQSTLNKLNVQQAHSILTRHILPKNHQGKMRTGNMYVTTSEGKIEYIAVNPFELEKELNKFYNDVEVLLNTDLTFEEILYYASLIHLVFVKIHPFDDGNGRTARLLEKWFLAKKLGEKAWFIESEKNYYSNHKNYYNNIRHLGLEYETLSYEKSLPFLLMLPRSLVEND